MHVYVYIHISIYLYYLGIIPVAIQVSTPAAQGLFLNEAPFFWWGYAYEASFYKDVETCCSSMFLEEAMIHHPALLLGHPHSTRVGFHAKEKAARRRDRCLKGSRKAAYHPRPFNGV